MWIKREVFTALRETSVRLETLAKQYYTAIAVRDAEIRRLQGREIDLLRELGAKVALETRATAVADIWRLRVNELTLERAALLKLALPTIEVTVPVMQRDPITAAPGIDFEDMGDASAQMTGALVGDGELRVDDPTPTSVKGSPLFSDPAELLGEGEEV